ncbi:glycosyltransferase [Candidatus Uhrbacteria bacterium]|nr:glycosyltransferase [Candidatus Uhrbacteria bacterium]
MRLLVIGLDTAVLDPASGSAERQRAYFQGIEADIFVLARGTERTISLSDSIHVFQPGGSSFFGMMWKMFWAVYRQGRLKQYDVMTVQDAYLCGWIGQFARVRNTLLHIQDHSAAFARPAFGLKERFLKYFSLWLIRRADRVRTVSQRGQQGLIEAGVDPQRIDVVPVWTDISRLLVLPMPTLTGAQLLCVARLSREKGIDILLQAFAEIRSHHVEARLTIVGDGPERKNLEQQAQRLNIASQVEFVGYHQDPARFYAQADIYVQPSRFEGWGRSVIEAAASGLPIVMTDVGCAKEIIQHEQSGLIVSPGDAHSLANTIERLLIDRLLAGRLGEQARITVQALPNQSAAIEGVRTSLNKASHGPVQEKGSIWALFGAAFAVRFILFAVILFFVGAKGLELGDSRQYLGLAQSLLAGQGFAYEGAPFFYRTIGYPLLLAGGLKLFGSVSGFIFFQIILASFMPLVVLKLGDQLGFDRRTTLIAAWLTALEPHMVFYSVMVMTESVYTLILLMGFYFVFRAIDHGHFLSSVFVGITFGLGLLIKPLLQFYPILVGIILLPWARRISWRRALPHALLVFVVAGILCTPWMYRNQKVFQKFTLTSQGSAAALFYLGTSIVSVRDKISYPQAEAKVAQEFRETYGAIAQDQSVNYTRAASIYIKENLGIFVRILAINTFTLWTSSNYNSFLNYYRLIPRIDHSVLPPTHYLAQGRIGEFVKEFWHIFGQPFYAIGFVSRIVWIFADMFLLVGMWNAYRRLSEKRFQHLMIFALLIYLTMTIWVDGLGIEARLRYPLMPFTFLYMAYGGTRFHQWVKRRRSVKLASSSRHGL